MSLKNAISNEDLSRFTIQDGLEIERVLRKQILDKTILTMHAEDEQNFLLTTLVGINPETGYIYLACSPDDHLNRILFSSHHAMITASTSQMRIQFELNRLERAKYGGEIVFKAMKPRTLVYIQRREYYRMAVPISSPVSCYFPLPSGAFKTVVGDVSVAGIGVIYPPDGEQLVKGEIYRGCRLALPESPNLQVDLEVCAVFKKTLKNGLVTTQAGCQFVKLPAAIDSAVQSYIMKVERERKARTG